MVDSVSRFVRTRVGPMLVRPALEVDVPTGDEFRDCQFGEWGWQKEWFAPGFDRERAVLVAHMQAAAAVGQAEARRQFRFVLIAAFGVVVVLLALQWTIGQI